MALYVSLCCSLRARAPLYLTLVQPQPQPTQVVCWPETSKYEAIFPPTESYLTVAVAESTCLEEGACSKEDWIQSYTPVCAIRASDGRIVCCCGSPDFMATIPTGSFTDIAISSLHGCGLLKEGDLPAVCCLPVVHASALVANTMTDCYTPGGIVCWGDETKGKIFAPNIPNGSGGAGPSGIVIQPDGEVPNPTTSLATNNVLKLLLSRPRPPVPPGAVRGRH